MTQRFCIYSRFSPRPNARECESIQAQEQILRAHVEKLGGTVCASCSDPDVSGGVFDRPGLSKALEALQRGDTLLVVDSSRLARDLPVLEAICALAGTAGARIESVQDGELFAPDEDPVKTFQRQIKAASDQFQRAMIRKRTRDGMRRKQANGDYVGGVPFGKQLVEAGEGNKLVDDADSVQVLERIVQRRGDGVSLGKIARELMQDGIPAPGGGTTWYRNTLKRILDRDARRG